MWKSNLEILEKHCDTEQSGVTRQRYETIKDYITTATRMPYLFIRGRENSQFSFWHGPCNRAQTESEADNGQVLLDCANPLHNQRSD